MTAPIIDRSALQEEHTPPPPEPDRLHVRWTYLAASFVLALLIGMGIAGWVRSNGGWEHGLSWERALMSAVHANTLPKVVDILLLVIPWLGTNWTMVPIVLAPAAWLWLRRRRRMLALHLLTLLVGSSALNFILKFLYDRPRPDLWERRGQYQFASYPSGHAISSVAVLITVAMLLQRFKGWRWPWFVAVLILGFSLYSRLYLGVHWPTDVIAGYAMGTVWLAGTLIAFTERRWQGARDDVVIGTRT
jgi:membrane-associated phospholipid phosphatase